MWTREKLKMSAKNVFRQNYWRCVLAGVVSVLALGSVGYSGASSSVENGGVDNMIYRLSYSTGISVVAIVIALIGFLAVSTIVSMLIAVFVRNPFAVGTSRFFLKNTEMQASAGEIVYAFNGGRYLKIVGTMLLRSVFIFLWSLLFIIPGVIRFYDYYLVSYIMADDPQISAMDALRKSKEMMRGQRFNTFVLNLSFIPWTILSAFTLGLLSVFYVNPYKLQTDAQLYKRIKEQYYYNNYNNNYYNNNYQGY